MVEVVIAAGEIVNELIFPPVFFGLITLGIFGFLGMVMFSYRDVANRHRQKTGASTSDAGQH
jgi:heme/copper-type cytochrome/quinol oxidase subunit 2